MLQLKINYLNKLAINSPLKQDSSGANLDTIIQNGVVGFHWTQLHI